MNEKMWKEGFAVGRMASVATIAAQEVEWLWPGRIAADELTLLAGEPDVGKSMVALDLAARVSRGGEWPDGAPIQQPGGVLLLTAVDHKGCAVRPRLEAAGADLARIYQASHVRIEPWEEPFEPHETSSRPINLAKDSYALASMLEEIGDCQLVVIDPLSSFLGGGSSSREMLFELTELATNARVAVLGVTHLKGGQNAVNRAGAGMALTHAARAMWLVTRDPTQEQRRLLLPAKNNLAQERTGLAFEMIRRDGAIAPRVDWSSAAVEISADKALDQLRRRPGPDPVECEAAEEFLRAALADGGRLVKEVEEEALEIRGIRSGTLRVARTNLGLIAYREQIPGPWSIRLRTDEDDKTDERRTISSLTPCKNAEELQEMPDEDGVALERRMAG